MSTPSSDLFTTMTYRIQSLEQQLQQTQTTLGQIRDQMAQLQQLQSTLQQMRDQMNVYVRTSENDIRLQSIQATATRIEQDLRDALLRFERDIAESKRQLGDLATKVSASEAEAKTGQDKVKLWVLGGIVSFVFIVLSGVLIAFATHLIH
jgi:uncharacterized protein YhaN